MAKDDSLMEEAKRDELEAKAEGVVVAPQDNKIGIREEVSLSL